MDHLDELANTEHKADDRASYLRFIEADTESHNPVAQLPRNPLLIRAVAGMRSQMERIMYASIVITSISPKARFCGWPAAIPACSRRLFRDGFWSRSCHRPTRTRGHWRQLSSTNFSIFLGAGKFEP